MDSSPPACKWISSRSHNPDRTRSGPAHLRDGQVVLIAGRSGVVDRHGRTRRWRHRGAHLHPIRITRRREELMDELLPTAQRARNSVVIVIADADYERVVARGDARGRGCT